MAPSVAEVNAVVDILEAPHEGASTKDVALLIIDALDNVRWNKDKWVMVARIKLPNGHWHNFAMGPYTTIGQAQKAGEAFMPNAFTYKRDGDCFFRAVPVVTNDKTAWEAVRPEHATHLDLIKAEIKKSVGEWTPWSWARIVAGRDGWAHKPKTVKEVADKSGDHA